MFIHKLNHENFNQGKEVIAFKDPSFNIRNQLMQVDNYLLIEKENANTCKIIKEVAYE